MFLILGISSVEAGAVWAKAVLPEAAEHEKAEQKTASNLTFGCVVPWGLDGIRWAFHAKRAGRLPGLPFGGHQCANYLAMVVVLPKRLRNFSTRPPMLSTDFCVPV